MMTRYARVLICTLVSVGLVTLPGPAEAIKIKIRIKITPPRIPSIPLPLPIPIPGIPPIVQVPLNPGAAVEAGSKIIKAANDEVGKITGNIVREAGVGYANLEREAKKGATNVETNLRKAGGDIEKTVRQAGGDVGRELKKAHGEVEDAAVAVYRFTVRQAESSRDMLSDAEQRFREGKIVDAVWHLGIDPLQRGSENAALAASESAVLSTVGSIAASAYGGPGGAAAYAAWLAYYQTGGDVNAALRVGLMSAVQSYAGQYAQTIAAPAGAQATLSESFKKAAVGGALNGLAVAASGGSAEDVRNAMLATAGSMLVQDGYQALASTEAVATFAKTAKQVYCVKTLIEQNVDKSCPSLTDYIKDGQGRYAMLDSKGNVQYVDLAKEVPGSEWLFLSREEAVKKATGIAAASLELDKLPVKEISADIKAKMKEADKVKGANIVSLLDDRWALSYTPEQTVASLKAKVAPVVVLNYVGLSPAKLNQGAAAAKQAVEAALPIQPAEIISCAKGTDVKRYWVSYGKQGDTLKCVTGLEVNGKVTDAWYAKNEGNFCQQAMVETAKKDMGAGFACYGR